MHSGCLGGLKIGYPPGAVLLEVISAGIRIIFSNEKKKEQSVKREHEEDMTGPPPKRQKQSGDVEIPKSDEAVEVKATSQLSSSSNQQKPTKSKMPDLLKLGGPQRLVDVGSATLTRPSGSITTDTQSKPDATYKENKSGFSVEMFSTLLFHVLFRCILPLHLEYTAQYTLKNIPFDIVLFQHKTWKNVFGVENFEVCSSLFPVNPLTHTDLQLQDIVITADVPTKSANKAFGKMAEKAALDEGFACRIKSAT